MICRKNTDLEKITVTRRMSLFTYVLRGGRSTFLKAVFGGVVESRRKGTNLDGLGLSETNKHVFKYTPGLKDCDINFHVNNSAYVYAAELARWHFLGSVGLIPVAFRLLHLQTPLVSFLLFSS